MQSPRAFFWYPWRHMHSPVFSSHVCLQVTPLHRVEFNLWRMGSFDTEIVTMSIIYFNKYVWLFVEFYWQKRTYNPVQLYRITYAEKWNNLRWASLTILKQCRIPDEIFLICCFHNNNNKLFIIIIIIINIFLNIIMFE